MHWDKSLHPDKCHEAVVNSNLFPCQVAALIANTADIQTSPHLPEKADKELVSFIE